MSRWLSAIRTAVRSWFRSRVERELNEELDYHLERQIQEERNRGLSPEDARLAALRTMGAIEKHKDECRDQRSGTLLGELIADVRYAARTLRRSIGFTLLVVGIMGVGIGANTAVFSIVSGVLLKPLPYPDADRVVALRTAFVTRGDSQALVSMGNFRDWRDQATTFEALSTYRPGENSVTTGTTAEYGRFASVDPQFFRVFGLEPVVGRVFLPDEVGPDAPPNALVSYAYWQSHFGGDPRVLERTLRVGNTPRTIIGVMPPGFQFPGRTDIWLPQTTRATNRTSHSFFSVGRLAAGVSLEQAQADLATVANNLARQFPESNKDRGVLVVRLQDELVGSVRLTLYLLWGMVGLVLVIACANTATLLLGKASARTREVAVRTALGASRRRIVRQLLTESALLAFFSGAFGLLLAYWGGRALVALAPAEVVRAIATGIDARVLLFTFVISMITSLLFGLVPAFHASRVDLIDALKQGGARAVMGGHSVRTRSVLVVAEISLAVMLLTGAGLLLKSLRALHNVELGYQPTNALVMKATGNRTRDENNAYFRALFAKIAAHPGVIAVGATSTPPGDLSNAGTGSHFIDFLPEVRGADRGEPPTFMTIVAPGTFAALGIPLKRGRDFNEGDTNERPLVAIVNEALVRQSLTGQDPIGRKIFCPFDRRDAMTIIGVVGNVRQQNPAIEAAPECYMPYTQHNYNSATLNVIVRTVGDPAALAATIRRFSAEASPQVPVAFTTMEEAVFDSVQGPRFRALLFGLFAGVAVCLAMAGVYGVMAYAVDQRSKEIGLRMALGADRSSVLRMILRNAGALTAMGLFVGLTGAAAATRLLETVLFDVRPLDLEVYVSVIGLSVLITTLAGYLPAWRAAMVNPIEVLKRD
jgi:putative ABC transport system permease protein